MPDTTQAPSRENVFTRKIGPLPMWLWVVIIAVPLLVYSLYKQKKSATTPSTTGTGTASTTSASQVPQFVNQTYTTVIPPAAPTAAAVPGPTGPVGDHTHTHDHDIHPAVPSPAPPQTPTPAPAPPAPGPAPAPPATPPAPAPVAQYFTVQPWSSANVRNSTVDGIAAQFGLSESQLLAMNPGITNPNLIYAGQQIRVK
jgi:LysM repeat protein